MQSQQSRLGSIPIFAGLPDEQLEPLLKTARRQTIKTAEHLFKEGDEGNSIFVIERGRIKVYTLGADDVELELDILGPGDVLGELAVFDGQPRSASALALTVCDLLAVDRDSLMEHLLEHPKTAIEMLAYLSRRMRQITLETEALSLSDSTARLAHTLLFLAERDGEAKPGTITTTLRTKDLAEVIGTSPEWVARMLARWRESGIIEMTGPRSLVLLDIPTLKSLCRRDD